MEFTAAHDTTVKVVTTGVCILFLAIGFWNARSVMRAKGDALNIVIRFAIFIVLIVSIVMAYVYSTTGYETRGKSIIIKRHSGEMKLTYMQIVDVRMVAETEMADLKQNFATSGLFGYYGHYHNASIGDMTFYGTQQKNWVLMHTDKNEAIIVTPDEPYKFVYEVKAIITPNN